MKKTISIIISILLFIFFSTASAHADRKTMEGFMLGTGIAILGTAIYNGVHREPAPGYTHHPPRYRHNNHNYAGHRNPYKRKFRSHHTRGHWEIEKIWVKPIYENKWNPSHYNQRGEWVEGRNENFLIQDGYWHTEKIWMRH